MAKINYYWEVNEKGAYNLMFPTISCCKPILQFVPPKSGNEYVYISDFLKVEHDVEYLDSIDEAKEEFEYKVQEYIEDKIAYYEDLLSVWEEDDNE